MAKREVLAKIKEIKEKIVVGSPEARFKKDVENYQRLYNVSEQEAQKAVFKLRAKEVQEVIEREGIIEPGSKEHRNFFTALNVLFGPEKLKEFREASRDPQKMRQFDTGPVTKTKREAMINYYKVNFEGKIPNLSTIDISAKIQMMIYGLLDRFLDDPRLASKESLEIIIFDNPELSADLGKVLEALDIFEKERKKFGIEQKYEKSKNRLKEQAKESVAVIFWRAPIYWLKVVISNPYNLKGFNRFLVVLAETVIFLSREVKYTTKLLYSASKTFKDYLETRFI